MITQLQFSKTLFRRFLGNQVCMISGRIWLMLLWPIKFPALWAATKYGQKCFEMWQESNFLPKHQEKTKLYQQQCCQTKCQWVGLFVVLLLLKKKKIRVCVFAHTCMQIWKDNKSSEMLLPITYCKFGLGIMKSVNSLSSSPFPLWYFLYFPPPSGSFNVLIVWKKFFCYLLWSSSDIKFTFEGQRMYQKFLYYLSC